jgi:uncharacterized protein YjbI with pentapeptide repeats
MPQSFSQANLRGKSFKGQDLKGANFSCTDIRGANFVHANLRGADLSGAKAGLTWRWVLLLAISAVCGAGVAGIICGYAGAFIGHIGAVADALKENKFAEPTALDFLIATGLPLGAMLLMGAILLRRGLGQTIAYSVAIATGLVLFATFSPDQPGLDRGDLIIPFLIGRPIMLLGALGGIVIGAITIAVAIKVFPKALFIAGFIAILGAMGGAIEAMTGAMTGSPIQSSTPEVMDWVFAGTITTCFLGCMTYIGLRACQGDKKYTFIQNISSIVSAFGGTSFRGADLSDANFNQATLKSTDFRRAILARTNWHEARNLDQARIEGTYLADTRIRDLVVTKNGHEQTFDRQDLRKLNLQDANLTDASLIGTDLTHTTLQGADLSRTKLVQAQLYGANLTGSQLTGAYIENWGISPDTNLNGIQCDYIYMHLPTQQDPDPYRKPDNRQETFQVGEFASFIAPIIRTLDSYKLQHLDPQTPLILPKTLDLLHREGIDPNAAAIALRQLIEQNPEAHIEILSIEGRGNQTIRIQAKISKTADSDILNRNYFQTYNDLKSLTYPDLQQLLASLETKDASFRSLQNMIMSAIGSSKFYIEATSDPSVPPKTILVLAANPRGTTTLRLDEEVREIQRDMERGKYRDRYVLQQRWAVQIQDLRRALLDYEPQILHFSGHGIGSERPEESSSPNRDINPSPESELETEGLVFEDDTGKPKLVSIEALTNLFQLFSNSMECVILNACYSENQAQAISQHIPYVIGMKRAIGDRAAIEFAIGFYDGLLAGKSIEFSYRLGCSAIQTAGIPEHLTPVLKRKA